MGLSSAGSLPSLLHELRGRGAGDTCLIRVLDLCCLLVFVAPIGKRADEGAKGSWAGSLWALLQELGELGAGNTCQSTSDKHTKSTEAMAVWFT